MAEDEGSQSVEIEQKEHSEGEEEDVSAEAQTEKQRARKQFGSVVKLRHFYLFALAPPVKLTAVKNFDTNIVSIKPTEPNVRTSGHILNAPVRLKALLSFDRDLPKLLAKKNHERNRLESSFNLLRPTTLVSNSSLDKTLPDIKQLEANKISRSLETSKPLFAEYVSHVILKLDGNYSTQLMPPRSIEEQTPVKQSLSQSSEKGEAEPVREGGSGFAETQPAEDLLERYFAGLGDARATDSLIMVLAKEGRDPYIMSLSRICKELYRIFGTGVMHPRFVSNAKEVRDLGQDKIIVIHEKKKEGTDILFSFKTNENISERGDELKLDGFLDYLAERKLENYGYVIIYASGDTIKQLQSLLNKKIDVAPRIVEVTLNEASDYRRFASFAWGESYRVEDAMESFDSIFSKGEKQFDSKLHQILKKLSLSKEFTRKIRTGPSDESPLHYELKAFVIQCLSKRFKSQDIKVETKLVGENGMEVPDVQAREEIYEIETMYGEGHPDPMSKIKKRIEQRETQFADSKLGIVIPPLQALLYYKYLKTIKLAYKSGFVSLDFLVPNLRTLDLIPIEKMNAMLRSQSNAENKETK